MMHFVESQLTYSAVVGLSCRSPYFQPAGEFDCQNNKPCGHIADGGYSENSGFSTIFQIYVNLQEQANLLIAEGKIKLIKFNIIFISNVILPTAPDGEF
ncbi:MAG: hypothetical protein WBP31_14465 [Chitinophagales bacterium]|jgi:hypothetical protein|nr:hypothetical protein [Bacteroidota bacterium]MBK9504973.1 hypothetical protein [Bacteroidota bacterium]MBK9555979.1 hypothetical protein [Bacteroidota bacterium]MBL0279250.1 hypothetical protein [Bacteroidota bacterium]MBP9880736.1 hypothetical protein [Chitinophagales bacterium]